MQQFEPEIHLSRYLALLKSKRNILIAFFSTVVFVVTVASFLMRPVYRATTTLLIDLESPNVLTTSGSVALSNINYYAYKEYFQSQKEIVKSRGIISQVFDEFNLKQARDYARAKDPIKKFSKTIKVEPVRDTRLLLLHVDNKDPQLAAEIANRIADVYVARNLAYITKAEVINLLKNEYLTLQNQLTEYSKIYKDKHPKMLRLRQEIEQMASRIKTEKERIGSDVDADISDLNLSGVKANNISVQDRAETPILPIRPKKRLNILLAMIVGLFGGAGLIFFFEYLDDTVKGLDDVKQVAQWPYLGEIPRIDSKEYMSEFQKDFFAHNSPKDPITEAYRSIRTSILFSSTEEHHLKSMIVTSPGPQEGKTTTLCNLGITMAQSKKKVLLVDADMRKPRLHEIFKKKNKVGLSNFLSEQAEFKDLIQKTEVENLSLVGGGPYPPNPSELLSSHKIAEFIKSAKKEFDFILFDTPPIAVVTDASILARAVDGVVLVLESGKTSRRALPRVKQLLEEARSRIVGVLFNKVEIVHSGYRYYYGKVN